MKKPILLVLTLLLVLAFAGSAQAKGLSPDKLEKAGWFCHQPNPANFWVHCMPPGAMSSSASITVMVFENPEVGESFLGTEILIRADLYHGQPCATDDGGDYHLLPSIATGLDFNYRACHHFDTSH